MLKKYDFGFDIRGGLLFLAIMIPNFIWFAVPAPNDVLRAESVTGTADAVASVCQVLMAVSLCILKNKERGEKRMTSLLIGAMVCGFLYYACWIGYYAGIANGAVILGLTVFPCLAFLLFAIDRRNWIAVIPTSIFTVCHLYYSVMNFLI